MDEKPVGIVSLQGCRCRCGHEWLPRNGEKPRTCPNCKSANWDKPKRALLAAPPRFKPR
jgi:predicted Zn-ribbon and HTH transcriptional regulator